MHITLSRCKSGKIVALIFLFPNQPFANMHLAPSLLFSAYSNKVVSRCMLVWLNLIFDPCAHARQPTLFSNSMVQRSEETMKKKRQHYCDDDGAFNESKSMQPFTRKDLRKIGCIVASNALNCSLLSFIRQCNDDD